MAVFFDNAAAFERAVQRAKDAAQLSPLARRGVGIVLRAQTQRLKALYPAAVPLGAGSWTTDEVIAFWAADPITPIRAMLNYNFTSEPGWWDSLTGGISSGWAGAWKWIGAAVGLGVLGLIIAFAVWAFRR